MAQKQEMRKSEGALGSGDSWGWSLIACFVFIVGIIAAYWIGFIFPPGELAGPDGYMWLSLVEAGHDSGEGWRGGIGGLRSLRSNAPAGEVLHWTLPYYVLLEVPTWCLSWSWGFSESLWAWGVVIGPLLLVVSVLTMVWGFRPLMRRGELFVATLFLLMSPGMLLGFQVARPDHQALSLWLLAWGIGLGIRLMEKPGVLAAMCLAGVTAIGLWVSMEGLLFWGVVQGVLVLAWLKGRKALFYPAFVYGITLVGVVGGILLFQWPREWRAVDSLSFVHVVVLGEVALFWFLLWASFAWFQRKGGGRGYQSNERIPFQWRLGLLIIVGVVLVGLVKVLAPEFWEGPYGKVDLQVESIWRHGVVESRPLICAGNRWWGMFFLFCGTSLPALGFALKEAGWEKRRGRSEAWFLVGSAVVGYLMVALVVQQRMMVHVGMLSAIPWALLLWRLISRWGINKMRLSQVFVVGNSFSLLGAVLLIVAAPPTLSKNEGKEVVLEANKEMRGASLAAMCVWLDKEIPAPARIITFLNNGPEILYRTKHEVLSTPYHRNTAGILDDYHFFTAPLEHREIDGEEKEPMSLAKSFPQANQILQRRGVTYVLLRPRSEEEKVYYGQAKGPTLRSLLLACPLKKWGPFERIELPLELKTDFMLFRCR